MKSSISQEPHSRASGATGGCWLRYLVGTVQLQNIAIIPENLYYAFVRVKLREIVLGIKNNSVTTHRDYFSQQKESEHHQTNAEVSLCVDAHIE